MKIEFNRNGLILEEYFQSRSFDDCDYSIYLTFSPKELKILFDYYKVQLGDYEKLTDKILNHYQTYNSLKLFHDFFHNRGVYSTISEDVPLINS
jgi:hypothetical protein